MFIARGKEDALVTRNLVPGDAVYGEKRINIDVRICVCHMCSVCSVFCHHVRFQLVKHTVYTTLAWVFKGSAWGLTRVLTGQHLDISYEIS